MQHESTEVIESKAIPGITFTLVRMVEGHRVELRRMSAAVSRKMRPMVVELGKLDAKWEKLLPRPDAEGKVSAELVVTPEMEAIQDRVSEISEELDYIEHTEMEAIWIKWALRSIDGEPGVGEASQQAGPLTIDGKPPGPENIAYGPPALYREIVTEIRKRLGLGQAATKNSSSPTISTESADGKTGDLTATSAEPPATDSTVLETVGATSPTT